MTICVVKMIQWTWWSRTSMTSCQSWHSFCSSLSLSWITLSPESWLPYCKGAQANLWGDSCGLHFNSHMKQPSWKIFQPSPDILSVISQDILSMDYTATPLLYPRRRRVSCLKSLNLSGTCHIAFDGWYFLRALKKIVAQLSLKILIKLEKNLSIDVLEASKGHQCPTRIRSHWTREEKTQSYLERTCLSQHKSRLAQITSISSTGIQSLRREAPKVQSMDAEPKVTETWNALCPQPPTVEIPTLP